MAAAGSSRNIGSDPQLSTLSQRNLSQPLELQIAFFEAFLVSSSGAGEYTVRANNDWMVVG